MSVNYPAIQKNVDNQNAEDVPVDTTAFNNKLSASDIDVQTALETLDDHTHTDTLLSITATAITESIDIATADVIRQTSSGITTTLTNLSTGSSVTIKNRGGGNNTINHTIDGLVTPLLADGDSVRIVYNGTDFDYI
jgi:hypothetical protein